MAKKFTHRRRVEFRDTDTAGIVHFSVFFAYMEEAEHEFLRELGLGVMMDVDGMHISWPRVAAKCNYRSAIRFEDMIDIEVAVAKIGSKSVTYDFQIRRDETMIADGQVTTVCCKFEHDDRLDKKKMESVEIPKSIVELLSPYEIDG